MDGEAPGGSGTSQGIAPGSGPAGLRRSLESLNGHGSLLLVLGVLVLVGAAARRSETERPSAPTPAGWAVAAETGASLCLAFDGDTVWVGGKSGLHRVDRATGAYRGRVDFGVSSPHVRSVAVDKEGAVWVGHLDGLARLSGGRWEHYGEEQGLPNKRVNALLATERGLVVGTGAGPALAERGAIRSVAWGGRLASHVVNVLLQTSDGTLWVGSSSDPSGGVSRVRGDRVETMRVAQGLPHPYVQAFAEPIPGLLWVATGQFDKGGAALLAPTDGRLTPSRVLTKADGLAGEKVRSVGVDAEGRVWFGSESDGLAVQNGGEALVVLTTRDGLPHNEVTAIARDVDGTMWLATLAGVVRIESAAARTVGARSPVREAPSGDTEEAVVRG